MTERDFERGRGGHMKWRNGFQEEGQFGPQEDFDRQGIGNHGQFGGQSGGYGPGYGRQRMNWQQGEPQGQRFSSHRQFGGWEGGYGPPTGYEAPGYSVQSPGEPNEAWRHGHSHESWEHGQSGRGFWGQGHPTASQQGFGGQGAWHGQPEQGFAGQSGGWQGSGGSWEQGYGEPWSQGSQSHFGGQSYGSRSSGPVGSAYEEQWMIRGPYAGRGPRGYQRNDARIEEDICERFTRHGHLDASDIEVMVANGEVTLTGTVESRHAKRLAEDILDSISGVKDVHNQLRVQQINAQAEWSQTDMTSRRDKSGNQSGRNEKVMTGASSS